MLAVVSELKSIDPKIKVTYIAQSGDHATAELIKKEKLEIAYIRSGKFRRFHGISFIRQLADVKTVLKNIYDAINIPIGIYQSWRLIGKKTPDVVFIKGGYVGLPVGIAAHLRKTPIVTHDSDAVPGMTNRILSKWSSKIAVTMPKQNYSNYYPEEKIIQTGLPVSKKFAQQSKIPIGNIRKELNLPQNKSVILIAAGSLGARNVNNAILAIAKQLLNSGVAIVHITGRANFNSVNESYESIEYGSGSLIVRPFVDNLAEFSRAADLVVTRSGSMIIELAAQAKAVISVPNPLLTDGHQLKNAEIYQKEKAVVCIDENKLQKDPKILLSVIVDLLQSSSKRKEIGKNLSKFYDPDSANKIANILIESAKKRPG